MQTPTTTPQINKNPLIGLFAEKDLSFLLKAKGFDDLCMAYHTNHPETDLALIPIELGDPLIGESNSNFTELPHLSAAPLLTQVIDWLDEKGIFVRDSHQRIVFNNEYNSYPIVKLWQFDITQIDSSERFYFKHVKAGQGYKSKKEALIAGIKQALNLIPDVEKTSSHE